MVSEPAHSKWVAVKANIATREGPTNCGSAFLADYTSPFDATVVDRLKQHGYRIGLKTNMDEFGMGSFGLHSAFGSVTNPALDATAQPRVAGGSSSGSAAVVAAGQVPLALGSDTGGSVRVPAAFCGIVGYKPSYGRLSRWGLVSYASSFDCVGVLASSVDQAEAAMQVMQGHDSRDETSLNVDWAAQEAQDTPVRRVGVIQEAVIHELAPAMHDRWELALQQLAQQHCLEIDTVSVPTLKQALAAYYMLVSAEAASNLSRYNGLCYGAQSGAPETFDGFFDMYSSNRTQYLGDSVKQRIMTGNHILSRGKFDSYYLTAARVRAQLTLELQRVFERVDVLVLPTTADVAPTIEAARNIEPVQEYATDVYTVPFSLAGLPAISVPCGRDPQSSAPMGLQVVAPRQLDHRAAHVARLLEAMSWPN
ncbi:uncharacterized protein MONBRDRAFT_25148 [Monosiga brevicollis MX1]|uniref:Glutamyl-tRNA(Gln) amidotransferase subunit A, mitochondrial n=1 Tax=Monosiga brevicollis TaxID=81824 RepID=A9UYJ7_MONBE|nr:uncharacterized protein MONBRDRAFT_25148 [Monosiga brevicollis MX1]EDQ89618.1 predicted protein [Monosiga brevicollis MX1]|eukprot:XP_001745647.1 hypothetical protein [Monosiga brevicollis MX1]